MSSGKKDIKMKVSDKKAVKLKAGEMDREEMMTITLINGFVISIITQEGDVDFQPRIAIISTKEPLNVGTETFAET